LHDRTTGKAIGRLPGHDGDLRTMQFSPDGSYLVAHYTDGALFLWRLKDKRELARLKAPGWIFTGMAFSPDGKTLAMPGEGYKIRLREVPSLEEKVATIPGPLMWTFPIGFSPDGKTLFTGGDGLRVWDVPSAREIRQPLRHLKYLQLSLSPDGKFIAVGHYDRVLDVLDAATGKLVNTVLPVQLAAFGATSVGFSPDGKQLAMVESHDGISIFDAQSWRRTHSIRTGDLVYSSAFSPDGKLLAIAHREELKVVELPSGKIRFHHNDPAFMGRTVFSPDGKSLAWRNGDGMTFLTEVATGKIRRRFPRPTRNSDLLVYSPCGRLLIGTDGFQVRDAGTDELIGEEGRRDRSASELVFSPDGKHFATGSGEASILIWETAYFLERRPAAGKLTPSEAAEMWKLLSNEDAAKAYHAMERLAASPGQAIALLREQMRPTPTPDERRITNLITMLSSAKYPERRHASSELKQLGEPAWPILERQLTLGHSLETRRRIEELLKASSVATPDYLRDMRALEVLERIGSKDAVRVLEAVAKGCPTMRRTKETKACLARLAK
jgi:WD40 repeat protein